MTRFRLRRLVPLLVALIGSACGGEAVRHPAPVKLTIWDVPPPVGADDVGLSRAIEAFDRAHPEIEVEIGTAGEAESSSRGGGSTQRLLTAIAGGVAPDVVFQDRFTIGGLAARGAFMPLDSLLSATPAIRADDFYPAALAECVSGGQLYGLPFDIDARALFYNKTLFRRAGLDPDRPPRTWAELQAYARRLTTRDADGRITTLGFSPTYGNTFYYLYSFLNGGRFLSADGRHATFQTPENLAALRFMTATFDSLGGRQTAVDPFERGFGTDLVDPFATGRVAMKIDGNWALDRIARRDPDMDVGFAPPPTPDGRPGTTWSGGFAFVIPTGAAHPREAWQLMTFLATQAGHDAEARAQAEANAAAGHPFAIPKLAAHRPSNVARQRDYPIQQPALRSGYETFVGLLDRTSYRPVTPVGQRLWDEQLRAMNRATLGTATPEIALRDADRAVQADLDAFYGGPTGPPLATGRWLGLGLALLVGLTGWLLVRLDRLRRRSRSAFVEARAGVLFALPWIVGLVVFTAGPILASFVLSLTDYDVLHPPRWVGVDNYRQMVSVTGGVPNDPLFWRSLGNTIWLTAVGVPLSLAVGLGLAMLVDRAFRAVGLFRTLFTLPSILPTVAVAALWVVLLNPEIGLVNSGLRALGLGAPNWLGDARWTKPAVLLMLLWGAGGGMLIWLAGLRTIPTALYEAAALDGAGPLARFRHVTLPLLSPYLFFNLIMGIIAHVQIFAQPYILDPTGGADDSLLVYVFYLFNRSFKYFQMGYASALAWVLFGLVLVLTVVNFRLAPRWVHYRDDG